MESVCVCFQSKVLRKREINCAIAGTPKPHHVPTSLFPTRPARDRVRVHAHSGSGPEWNMDGPPAGRRHCRGTNGQHAADHERLLARGHRHDRERQHHRDDHAGLVRPLHGNGKFCPPKPLGHRLLFLSLSLTPSLSLSAPHLFLSHTTNVAAAFLDWGVCERRPLWYKAGVRCWNMVPLDQVTELSHSAGAARPTATAPIPMDQRWPIDIPAPPGR